MSSDEFVIYLSSREDKSIFKDNKASGFTNVISPSLVLKDEYIVSLCNIAFSPQYHCIKKYDPAFFIYLHFKTFDDNGLVSKVFTAKYLCSVNITGESTYKAIQQLNNDFVSFCKTKNLCKRSQEPIFRYKSNDCYVTLGKFEQNLVGGSTEMFWGFSKEMGTFLGIDTVETTSPQILSPVKIPKKVDCFFIYTDIVHPSHLGGGKSIHLIDIIPTDTTRGKYVPMLQYKTVNRNLIEDISIKITDQCGNDIQFDDQVDIICVLHFKLK